MKNIRFAIVLIGILLGPGFTTFAQNVVSRIQLKNEMILLPENGSRFLDSVAGKPGNPLLVLIQFHSLPDKERLQQLAGSGIVVQSYLSDNTFLARLSGFKRIDQISDVRSIVPFEPKWKIAPALLENVTSNKLVDVIVSVVPGEDMQRVKELLTATGGRLTTVPISSYGFYPISIPSNKILALAAQTNVLFIGPAARNVPLNQESQRTLKANIAHAPALAGGYGLLGDSMTVGVGDNVPGLWHIDLRDRIINYNPVGYSNHGQHTNGTVGGAGTVDPKGEGFAPHARLIDEIYDLIWQRTGPLFHGYNMTVTNNSYANAVGSCKDAGVYDVYAQALDTVALNFPEVLHVFAAGNDGGMSCPPYPPGFETVTGGYQTAKNAIVVANITKQNIENGGTSRGPIKDGRLKPEISAVGSGVFSTKGGDIYLSANGTSMAAPQITGSAALLQQRYKQLHAGAYPSSALVKALLMNGAMDIGNPGPDFTFGYGVADVSRSLAMIDNSRYLSGSIANGATQTPITITVPANTGQLKVMLYWHDAPASPSSSKQLVNDLDLKLTDAGSTVHLPFILNATPANVTQPATTGADHLNNVEQVVIDNPAAGSYTVNVSGFAVPFGPQNYVLVYDFIPSGITVTTPFKNGVYKSGDWLDVYWNASPGTNTFTVEISYDNGGSWNLWSNNVPAANRTFLQMNTSGVNSSQCLFRVTRNGTGEQSISGPFTLNEQSLIQLNSVQCPGYVGFHWNPVKNATSYNVLQKIGYFLQQIANTSDTNYLASGLSTDSNYFFTIEPVFGTTKGYRSVAINRKPDNGNCSGSFTDGDLMLSKIITPSTGRIGTSTALSSNETLSIPVRNLDDAAAGSYKVSYQVNGGAWTSQTLSNIPATGTSVASFSGLNLGAPGMYVIRAAVANLSSTDNVPKNDTIVKVVRQLQNNPVNLASGFLEDFETHGRLTLMGDSLGFSPDERWDYNHSNDTGRMRSFVDEDVSISGLRSLSMDMLMNAQPVFNKLTGTFNLATSSTASDEVRMEFDYRIHGKPKSPDSNKVWIRGNDLQPWIPIYSYNINAPTGNPINSGTLSVTDALINAGQTFSSSMQVAFGQYDTSVIAQNDYGNGLTLDNIKLYKVVNDVGITAVTSPAEASCQLGSTTPLIITVANGVTAPVANVELFYQLDGGAVVRDTILSLAGKSTVSFTFRQLLNTAGLGAHVLNIWLHAANDSYNANDSILGYVFRNEPVIASFPYLENFESGDGYWYPGGVSSSWAYGTPASTKVKKAASGVKAWKTNLTGHYNDNEQSYLYSPCFNLNGLSKPMLSFSGAMEIENCGSLRCDGAWVEYAENGGAWKKLGAAGQGTNWYSDTAFQIWNEQRNIRWKVSSIPIPVSSQSVRFRFAMSSDAGAGYEGLAVDDIHIFDAIYPLYQGTTTGPVEVQVTAGSGFNRFLSAGPAILAMINPGANNLGKTSITLYTHNQLFERSSSQYLFPRNFVLNAQTPPSDSVIARFFIADADVLAMVNDTVCAECSKAPDAYELGITRYHNADIAVENGSLTDNVGGNYEFIPASRIKWVPYDAGYYAELKLGAFSEIWFNDGGAGQSFPITVSSVVFDATKTAGNSVLATWSTSVDTMVVSYEVQRSVNARDFASVDTQLAVHSNSHGYSFMDFPGVVSAQALYYRLKYTLRNGKIYYSVIRQIIWSGGAVAMQVYPNPSPDGVIKIGWSTQPGTRLDVSVTDVAGRIVLKTSATATNFYNITELNIGGEAKGIYFLNVLAGNERFNFKVLAE